MVVQRPRRRHPGRGESVDRVVDRPLHRRSVPRREEKVEPEHLLELVGPDVLGEKVRTLRRVGLGDHHEIATRVGALVLVDHATPVTPHDVALGSEHHVRILHRAGSQRVRTRRLVVGELGLLADRHRCVDAEPVNAAIEPEAERVVEVLDDVGVLPVPVRLFGSEHVQVPLTRTAVGLDDACPRRPTEVRQPVVRCLRTTCALAITEPEPGALHAPRAGGDGRAEPGVLVAAMVRHDVHEHTDVEGMGLGHERVEHGEVAVIGLDGRVVGNVVAVVVLRRRVARVEPDPVDTELGEVAEPATNSTKVADAVTVGVGEGPHVDLVHHARRPPGRDGRTVGLGHDVSSTERLAGRGYWAAAVSTLRGATAVVSRTTSSIGRTSLNGCGFAPPSRAPSMISAARTPDVSRG